MAATCVLLVGTGLLARSLKAAQDLPLGFDPGNILTGELYLTSTKYRGNDGAMQAFGTRYYRRFAGSRESQKRR